jgi:protein-S-isoprenylcysteine O-methyltransferase Ste14
VDAATDPAVLALKDFFDRFLTYSVSILVFSITFSEKIVDFHRAPEKPKRLIVAGWRCLSATVLLCAVGMTCVAIGGETMHAIMFPNLVRMMYTGIVTLCFVAGLGLLIWAGRYAAQRTPPKHSMAGRESVKRRATHPNDAQTQLPKI